jgi:hypothetical protein
MARVNVGICPSTLSDQHLLAESVEITMITGALKKDGYIIKGEVPQHFCLGKGHINFFKNKLQYLSERLECVNAELINRGFKPTTKINQANWPPSLWKPWKPTKKDTAIVRDRVILRLKSPLKATNTFHRHYSQPITDMEDFCEKIKNNKLNEK